MQVWLWRLCWRGCRHGLHLLSALCLLASAPPRPEVEYSSIGSDAIADTCVCSRSALDDFVKSLKRHLALLPLIKSCSLILSQPLTLRKMVQDLRRIDFAPIHEDVSLLTDQECQIEVRSLVFFFDCDADAEEESVLTMNNLAVHVKESVHRFILRNEVGTAALTATPALITSLGGCSSL